ncbi:MFS general substrate transporter [Sodiomyces alkalinus F11]|uniref:MFS general substrate transporter n=1 Tax=Sodiomyces alkalinus (strain CBS 110278 / VKM F-3762 / F11) TaxID=1314773 RepID=A0A3N2Q728_SODAK|nr:MFS general substrate transporter [Sodiomyces alkalinus F11]ROT42591.1 MFS general substrate transporter [Sodiomyces alkalinus F11]
MATTTTVEAPPIQGTTLSEAYELRDVTKHGSKPPSMSSEQPGPPEPPKIGFDVHFKIAATGLSFFVSGINDGSIGPLMPYFIRDHTLSTAVVSVIYVANFLGWLLAALTNTHLMQILDLGGLLAVGTVVQIIAHALRVWNPPFPLFAVTFMIVSVGQAYQDTGGNTYCSGVVRAHLWLAFIHAMYAGGCLVAPFVSTAVATANTPSRWYLYYAFPLGIGVFNSAATIFAFRDTIKTRFWRRRSNHRSDSDDAARGGDANAATEGGQPDWQATPTQLMKKALCLKSVWLISLFYFFFLGALLTAAGWVVEYLVQARGGDLALMGNVPAGLNGGVFLGRLLLAEPTHRYGERRMVFIYAVFCVAFQLVFWLVPNIIAALIAISFIGFFSGPFFATGMSVASKLVPRELNSTAMAFVFVFAQGGGTLFPMITGVLASRAGVSVLQPVLIGLWVACAISWLLIPKVNKDNNPDLHSE